MPKSTNSVIKSGAKLSLKDQEQLKNVAENVLRLLMEAGADNNPDTLSKIDSEIERVTEENLSSMDIIISGNTQGVYENRKHVDIVLPTQTGATLTIGLSSPDAGPIIYNSGDVLLANGEGNNATVEYYNTKTRNSGMEDIQGDSRSD